MKIKLQLEENEIDQIEYVICMEISRNRYSLDKEEVNYSKKIEDLLNKIRRIKWIQIEKAIRSEDN